MIKVLFFGVLQDACGNKEIDIEFQGSLSELKAGLLTKYPSLNNYDHLIAVNHELVHNDLIIKEGDEIALMPPFAGG